jgi:hypothetical protein
MSKNNPFDRIAFTWVPCLILLIQVTLIGAQMSRRIRAIEWAKQDGGFAVDASIRRLPFEERWPAWMRSANHVHISDKDDCDLRRLVPLHELVDLEINRCRLDSQSLGALPDFGRLRALGIFDSNVNDEDLRHLSKCSELKSLRLVNCPITDRGLKHLEKLPLKQLGLPMSQVTDAGLVSLASMPLESLNLNFARVTPRGLEVLRKVKSLKHLAVTIPEESRNEMEHLASVLGMSLREGRHAEWEGRSVIVYSLTRAASP